MTFKEAFRLMQHGTPMKLPSWGGYWYWDGATIMMHTKDGEDIDIRKTTRMPYTIENIISDDWVVATPDNCDILGGTAVFTFGDAVKYLKRGLKVARQGWNGKGMYLFYSPSLGCQIYKEHTNRDINDLRPFIVMKAVDETLVPWVASQTDILAEDWYFVE